MAEGLFPVALYASCWRASPNGVDIACRAVMSLAGHDLLVIQVQLGLIGAGRGHTGEHQTPSPSLCRACSTNAQMRSGRRLLVRWPYTVAVNARGHARDDRHAVIHQAVPP